MIESRREMLLGDNYSEYKKKVTQSKLSFSNKNIAQESHKKMSPEQQQDLKEGHLEKEELLSEEEKLSIPKELVVEEQIKTETKNNCEQCSKCYSNKSNLKKHIKEVHEKGPHSYMKYEKEGSKYKCKICKQLFPHSSKLKLHYSKKHKDEELKEQGIEHDQLKQKFYPRGKNKDQAFNKRAEQEHLCANSQATVTQETYIKWLGISYKVPILTLLMKENPKEHQLPIDLFDHGQAIEENGQYFKLYSLSGFLEDQKSQITCYNEFAIMKQAKEQQFKHIINYNGLVASPYHVGLVTEKHQMTLRKYLSKHRNSKQMSEIIFQMIQGVMELHQLGYIHRDLKPENVVLNIEPLIVRVIDFDRATLETVTSKGTRKGTPGYIPDWKNVRDGDKAWDIFSVACIILEADLEKDSFENIFNLSQITRLAKQYMIKGKVCKNLKDILNKTILVKDPKDMMDLDQIQDLIKISEFRSFKKEE